MKVLVITDNEYLYSNFKPLIENNYSHVKFEYMCSPGTTFKIDQLPTINVKMHDNITFIINNYQLVFSLHCNQIFPAELVDQIRCINIHPGYNPHNRGWFPHVFSIINGLPAGATIHLMDRNIDSGAIIAQREVGIEEYETSKEVYEKILNVELELIKENIKDILNNNYSVNHVKIGNINTKKNYTDLCKLDLDKKVSMREAINILRALSHGEYKNAYFYDENGCKIYIKIQMDNMGKPLQEN